MTRAPRATGIERTFDADEIIVTKTDLKGRITYANDVFLHVSAYSEADVLGQPHSIIRHPDMPAAVFRLLWETIAAGQEMFAYVCNLAGDGAHYWVFAHVTPTRNPHGALVGYHSSRRQAAPDAVERARQLYTRLCAEERRHSRAVDAAAAGLALLDTTLAELGHSYDEWVWQLASAAVPA